MDNVCVEVNDKEITVLVGLFGELVNDNPPKNRNIIKVFQNYAFYPPEAVYENMVFGLKLIKFDRYEIGAAKTLELENYLNKSPNRFRVINQMFFNYIIDRIKYAAQISPTS